MNAINFKCEKNNIWRLFLLSFEPKKKYSFAEFFGELIEN